MAAERRLERVLRMLDQARRTARNRPRAEIDKELGHSAGYLSRVCKGVFVLDVPTLLRAVDLLGVDVDLFLARAFGTGRHIDVERHLAGIAAHRPGSGPAILDRIEELVATAPPQPSSAGLRRATDGLRQRLRDLEDLCFVDAKRAKAKIGRLLKQIVALAGDRLDDDTASQLLCRSLGVAASIYRVRAHLPTSSRCLGLGLDTARRHDSDLRIRADLLQRSAYLLADDGSPEIGAEIALEALESYVLAGDRQGMGKVLVTRAMMLGNAGDDRRAIEYLARSLDYLNADHWRYRCAAFHGMGRAHFCLGELEKAAVNVERAKSLHRSRQGWNWAKLIWLEGEIALERGGGRSAIVYAAAAEENRNSLPDWMRCSLERRATAGGPLAGLSSGPSLVDRRA